MSGIPKLAVRRGPAEAVRRGHPWIYREAIAHGLPRGAVPGAPVTLVDEGDAPLGLGVCDPGSPIAVRVWATGDEAKRGLDALLRARLARAVRVREAIFASGETTAYRVVHGEGDRMPGVVIDRYADVAVVRPDGDAALAVVEAALDVIGDALAPLGVRTLFLRARGEAGRTARGPDAPASIEVKEHGVPFVVDLARGQKTGAFLDQRENRARVGALAREREAPRVLNLFSYAGGFSVHAARAGATVTSVDVATEAHATAQATFRLSGLDPRAHEFVTADAFAFLASAEKKRRAWDLVVSDPPSFAPNERSRARALAAYRALHRACARVLAPGGTFCAASCSSHVDARDFAETLDDAALGRADLSIVAEEGQPADHPTLAAWPEGRYLKFFILR